MKIQCPACNKEYDVPDSAAGKNATCKCSMKFKVAAPDVVAPEPKVFDAGSIPPPRSTRPCPYCAEPIALAAVKCKHCGEFLTEEARRTHAQTIEATGKGWKWLQLLGAIASIGSVLAVIILLDVPSGVAIVGLLVFLAFLITRGRRRSESRWGSGSAMSTTRSWNLITKAEEQRPPPVLDENNEVAPPQATKPCPFCAEPIALAAIKCKHCGEFLTQSRATTLIEQTSKEWKSVELFAGLLGLISVLGALGFGGETSVGFGMLGICVSFVVYLAGRFGAWWHHG